LLSSGFQRRTFTFFWTPELSTASAAFHFSQLQLSIDSTPSQSYITTDGQSVSLSWCQAPIWGPRPISLFLSLKIMFSQLRVRHFGTFSLTSGRACSLQLLLYLASAVTLESEFRGTHEQILLSQIWDSLNLEGQAPVFISSRNRVAQLWSTSSSSSRYIASDGQSASLSWCRAPFGAGDQIFKFLLVTITFSLLHVGCPL
jgi:hypothetical protein